MNATRPLLTIIAFIALGACGTTKGAAPRAAAPDHPEATSSVVTDAVPATPVASTTTTAPAPMVVLDLSGTGTKNSQEFTVGPKWDVAWSYDCAASGNKYLQTGNFIIMPEGDTFVSGSVNELGAGGADVQHFFKGGTFHLNIIAMCPWHVTVTSL